MFRIVVDFILLDYEKVLGVCCVVYLFIRDEVINLWFKGDLLVVDVGLYM